MKKNTMESKKDFSQNSYKDSDEEISLIDLAKIVVKRRKIFLVTASVIILFSLYKSFSLYQARPVGYVSIYKTATVSPNSAIEPLESIVESMESYYKQTIIFDLAKAGKEVDQIDIKFENPKGTLLISIMSIISDSDFSLMNDYHKAILDRLSLDQKKKIDDRLFSINEEIKFLQGNLEKTEKEMRKEESRANWKGQELVLVNYRDRVSTYEIKIKELERSKLIIKEGEVIQLAQKKVQRLPSGALLTLAIGFLLSILLGFIVIFAVEFYDQVKKSIEEEGIE